ncbi:hypothetical protein KI387_039422, partial [Taxus chinensis]
SGTKIHLMATAGLRRLKEDTQKRILESCRRVLRFSGFSFQDDWASVVTGADEGIFAWVAANYALGTLGGNPQKTTGIIELGGASFQVTFVPEEVPEPDDLHTFSMANFIDMLDRILKCRASRLLLFRTNATILHSVTFDGRVALSKRAAVERAAVERAAVENNKTLAAKKWKPPPFDFVKLNTDGEARGNPSPTSMGGIVHDSLGTSLFLFTCQLGHCTNNVAEILAIQRALLEATKLGCLRIIVESDSKINKFLLVGYFLSVGKGGVVDPCTPKGYTIGSEELLRLPVSSENVDDGKLPAVHSRGNFSECRNAALRLLSQGQGIGAKPRAIGEVGDIKIPSKGRLNVQMIQS